MNLGRITWTACILTALTSCTSAPPTSWQAGEPVGPEVQAIQELGQQLDAAWDRRDADAFAALFSEDGNFRFPSGTLLQGRTVIQQHYQDIAFPSFEADLLHQTTPQRIHFLEDGAALGDGIVRFIHADAKRPEDRLDFALHVTSALIKRTGKWQIAAVRLIPMEP